MAQEGLPSNVVASAQCLANVANLLNTRDTELSRWVGFLLIFHYRCSLLLIFFFLLLGFWVLYKGRCGFSFLVAMGDMSLRKTGVEEKRAKVQKESKILLDYTRKAIARLTYLKRSVLKGSVYVFVSIWVCW